MNSGTSYKNIAFISYKREDEKWAKWLQETLEQYTIPAFIRKNRCGLPKHVRPIFRDTTDLCGGVLEKAIKEGLTSSKFLIVICSPLAAKSQWVCKEVQEFIDSGREETIIPFIVEGEPYSRNPEEECFPLALKALSGERELLGININENGRDSAAIKVIARIFDIHFDSLWNRYQKQQRKKRRRLLCIIISIVISVLGVAGIIYSNNLKLKDANQKISEQNIILDTQRDSLSNALFVINQQNSEISENYNELNKQKEKLLASQCRLISEKVPSLLDERDYLLALALCNEVLPSSSNNRPYLPETEFAFRTVIDSLRRCDIGKIGLLKGHKERVSNITFSDDGSLLVSSSDDGSIIIWDTGNGSIQKTLIGDKDEHFSGATFGKDGIIYSLSSIKDKYYLSKWFLKSGQRKRVETDCTGSIQYDNEMDIVVTKSSSIYDGTSLQERYKIESNLGEVNRRYLCTNGVIISVCENGLSKWENNKVTSLVKDEEFTFRNLEHQVTYNGKDNLCRI